MPLAARAYHYFFGERVGADVAQRHLDTCEKKGIAPIELSGTVTASDVAALFGVSAFLQQEARDAGELPFSVAGDGAITYAAEDLQAWLEGRPPASQAGRIAPAAERIAPAGGIAKPPVEAPLSCAALAAGSVAADRGPVTPPQRKEPMTKAKTARQSWEAAIHRKTAHGKTHRPAVREVARENPGLQECVIREANADRPAALQQRYGV